MSKPPRRPQSSKRASKGTKTHYNYGEKPIKYAGK